MFHGLVFDIVLIVVFVVFFFVVIDEVPARWLAGQLAVSFLSPSFASFSFDEVLQRSLVVLFVEQNNRTQSPQPSITCISCTKDYLCQELSLWPQRINISMGYSKKKKKNWVQIFKTSCENIYYPKIVFDLITNFNLFCSLPIKESVITTCKKEPKELVASRPILNWIYLVIINNKNNVF